MAIIYIDIAVVVGEMLLSRLFVLHRLYMCACSHWFILI